MTRALALGMWSLCVVTLIGCPDQKAEAPPAPPPPAPAPPPAAQAPPAVPAGKGSISGEVVLTGTPPVMEPLKRGADPVCAKTPMTEESALVKAGKIENVVLRVKGAPNAPAPEAKLEVDQQDCMYRPRVQIGVAGQQIRVRNGDVTLHNVHAYEGTKTLFNQAQPPKSPALDKPSPATPDVIRLKCDVHPWMTGFVVFHNNGLAAVTKADGHFEIPDVPAGQYTLEAWHEKFGTKSLPVTVTPNQAAKVTVTYSADDRG